MTHTGFWRNYRNIDRLVVDTLKLTGARSPFTPFTQSSLYTKASVAAGGAAVVAPVLGDQGFRLPAPLGAAV